MPFLRMDIDAPDGPTTDDFMLRPIVAADADGTPTARLSLTR